MTISKTAIRSSTIRTVYWLSPIHVPEGRGGKMSSDTGRRRMQITTQPVAVIIPSRTMLIDGVNKQRTIDCACNLRRLVYTIIL